MLNDLQAPAGLRLREGAQVMLLANLNVTDGLVNGSRGVVKGFVSMKEAADDIATRAMLRGAAKEGESISMSELQVFARDNPDMMFPKVLFETTNTTREVPNPSALMSVFPSFLTVSLGYYRAIYVDGTIGLERRSLQNSNTADDGMGSDNSQMPGHDLGKMCARFISMFRIWDGVRRTLTV